MSDRELLAIMSAIIFAGADSATENAGYFPPGAVAVAQEILACVDARGNKPEEAKAAESTEPWIAEPGQ